MVRVPGLGTDVFRDGENLHFPTFSRVPNPPDKRIVEPGGPAATRLAEDQLTPRTPGTPQEVEFRLRALGEALHVQQDSWSHQGAPGEPTGCNATLAWAHPSQRGGWRSHQADHTWWDLPTAVTAAHQTYVLLVKHAAAKGWATSGQKPGEWQALESQVGEFMKAATKEEKIQWFVQQKFVDRSFLAAITLPNTQKLDAPLPPLLQAGPQQFAQFGQFARPVSSSPGNPTGKVPSDVLSFFRSFWGDWVGSSNLAQVVTSYMAGSSATTMMDALMMWRVRDHGAVSRIGHGVPSPGSAAATELANLFKLPTVLLRPAEFPDAMIALGKNGPPIVVLPAGTGRYAAIGRFRHAPYDSVMATAAHVQGSWRIVSITSVAEH